jgi:RNA-directed DNA polymerase
MDNIHNLQSDLMQKTYVHSSYQAFNISDPKPRNIHKATVRDRLLHHLLYSELYPSFDRKFIHDSYSCRIGKGTHMALYRFEKFSRIVSENNTKTCWVLKCDIRKFFASINHSILKKILRKYIAENDILWLLEQIINSFNTEGKSETGLPLGNLTSQLLVNMYMNEFDQFVKRELKIKYYIRYADDFVILDRDKEKLERLIPSISDFLNTKLALSIHSKKLFIKTVSSGLDFLGWVHFPTHRVLRTATKRRMLKNFEINQSNKTIDSYKGMLKHGNTFKISKNLISK